MAPRATVGNHVDHGPRDRSRDRCAGYVRRVDSWELELLHNDGASDAIGGLVTELADTAAKAGPTLGPDGAAPFCARLAVILRYDASLFERTDDEAARAEQLRAIVRENRAVLDRVAPRATTVFDVLADGRTFGVVPAVETLLQDRRTHATLQKLADHTIENTGDDLGSPDSGAFLHVLTFLAPYVELPGKTIRHWLRRMHELLSDADEDDDVILEVQLIAIKKLVAGLSNEDHEDDAE